MTADQPDGCLWFTRARQLQQGFRHCLNCLQADPSITLRDRGPWSRGPATFLGADCWGHKWDE